MIPSHDRIPIVVELVSSVDSHGALRLYRLRVVSSVSPTSFASITPSFEWLCRSTNVGCIKTELRLLDGETTRHPHCLAGIVWPLDDLSLNIATIDHMRAWMDETCEYHRHREAYPSLNKEDVALLWVCPLGWRVSLPNKRPFQIFE